MKSAQINFSKPLRNWLITLINYAMVAAFAAVLAYWVWVFFKPHQIAAVAPSAPPVQTILPTILGGHWFNQANTSGTKQVSVNVEMKLLGVMTPSKNQTGFAIFQLANGKQVHAVLNHEIAPGAQLVSLTPTTATISQNGSESTLELAGNVKRLDLNAKPESATGVSDAAKPTTTNTPPSRAEQQQSAFNLNKMMQGERFGK
ncbi:MAG: hypothetical protein HOP25_03350 [Methylotenera sp.]|nr:hypothetical protein [Methylotenera sp.]